MQKRIMMLGGNLVQCTAIKAAKALGYYVITVDYLPENPGHKFADEYHNISTIDKEAVLELARTLNIDGILSYASDVSAPTAAYVAEALGLPTNPYESVNIMTHKDLFRKFLRENGFPMPEGASFGNKAEALEFFRQTKKPVMVKPIDSSGSKGANKVYTEEEFDAAWEEAMHYSISKNAIVERFLVRTGYQIDGDAFVNNGEIVFWGICDQHHDDTCSLYAPDGHSYPPTQLQKYQDNARAQIEKLLKLLGMHMGGYNIEYIVDENDEVYLLEIGPRNGGNWIADAIKASTDFDMPSYVVKQAVGEDVSDARQMEVIRPASSYVIHATEDGIFKGIDIDPVLKPHITAMELSVQPGEEVHKFRNASFGLGMMVLTFDSTEQMCDMIDNMNDYLHIIVE